MGWPVSGQVGLVIALENTNMVFFQVCQLTGFW
jgi:hypothetical protein